ncbi:hypothetical protein NBRC116592_23300 [Colwellia sp. KU-HH00111]|uniref:hypothetical protein n=1 Tax=Colwellia sp. KU-HH00111 TaxID=3127652 RepID=UPI00310625AB
MKPSFGEYLKESGLSQYIKKDEDLDLCLYHDLNIYGDISEGYIELLASNYGVNCDEFIFEDYFPVEFYRGSFISSCIYTFLPFIRRRKDFIKIKYKKFRIRKFKQAIKDGWLR